jgi:hypothetical protein
MEQIRYREGYKYQLAKDYGITVPVIPKEDVDIQFIKMIRPTLRDTSYLLIRSGYAWDGPSGPTFDTPSFMRGSLVHDVLYQLIRLELLDPCYRRDADDILKEICKEDGMGSLRAWWVHKAVVNFAESACSPTNVKRVIMAP